MHGQPHIRFTFIFVRNRTVTLNTYVYYTRISSVNSLSNFQSKKHFEQHMYRNQNTHFIPKAFLPQILRGSRQTKVILTQCHNYVTNALPSYKLVWRHF